MEAPCTILDTTLLSLTRTEFTNALDSAQQVDWDLQELYSLPWPWQVYCLGRGAWGGSKLLVEKWEHIGKGVAIPYSGKL